MGRGSVGALPYLRSIKHIKIVLKTAEKVD